MVIPPEPTTVVPLDPFMIILPELRIVVSPLVIPVKIIGDVTFIGEHPPRTSAYNLVMQVGGRFPALTIGSDQLNELPDNEDKSIGEASVPLFLFNIKSVPVNVPPLI
jgi:hypothetical protein